MKDAREVKLTPEAWRAIDAVIADYLRFGPGDLDAEYIPDEQLETARRAIAAALRK